MKNALWRREHWRRGGPGTRPILSKEQIMEMCSQVLGMGSVGNTSVSVEHTARSTVQLAHGQVESSDDGDDLRIDFALEYNHAFQQFTTNESDPDVLRTMVKRCEAIMLDRLGVDQNVDVARDSQDKYVPVDLWHDSTVDAMRTTRETLVPQLVQPLVKQGLVPAGFVGFIARAKATMTKIPTEGRSPYGLSGTQAYYEETDCELSMTARTQDNTSSGWGGQANRRWEAIDPTAVAARAADLALRGVDPKAVEPGRRTAILTRDAVAQIMRYFAYFYDAFWTERAMATPFWKRSYPANRVGEKVFDPQIAMTSDPADPEGGFAPYFDDAYANPNIAWATNGVLKNLAHTMIGDAVGRSLPYSEDAMGLRISGGNTSIEQMIASCKEGIYVNHFGIVDINPSDAGRRAGVMTGTTRDGCFLVKDGKVTTAVKNFRFIDSPMFMLNNIIALGETRRAAYGFTPRNEYEPYDGDWPRRPIVVPPMMVRDFNFTALADAV